MIMAVELTTSPREPATGVLLADLPRRGNSTVLLRDYLQDAGESPVFLAVQAPQMWWRQAAVYFPDIFWIRSHKELDSSERCLTQQDFEDAVPEALLLRLNEIIITGSRTTFSLLLPDSFIRSGVVSTSTVVLRDIIRERGHYQDGHWAEFCRKITSLFELSQGGGQP